jgi:hypothetical protein
MDWPMDCMGGSMAGATRAVDRAVLAGWHKQLSLMLNYNKRCTCQMLSSSDHTRVITHTPAVI